MSVPKPPSTDMTHRIGTVRIAAFDFDGTLTYKDSFNAFLLSVGGRLGLAGNLIAHPGPVLDYLRTGDRGVLKARVLFNMVGNLTKAELDQRIADFVTKTGMGLFRPDALAMWHTLGQQGMTRVIITASPEMVVAPLGALIGADLVIGTRLKFSPEDRLMPELDGANCRGEEKVRRLRQVYCDDMRLDLAYGDTSGDTAMLAAADQGHYRLFKQRP